MNALISRINPLMGGNNSIEEQRIGLSLQDYLSASNTLEDEIIELLPEQIALLTLDENYSDRIALIIDRGNSTKNNLITSNQDSAFGRINLELSQIEQAPPQFAEIDDNITVTPIISDQIRYNLLFSEAEASSFTNSSENVILQQLDPGDNPAFDLIGLTQLRNDPTFAGIDGSDFAVAVIDSGIDYNHPLLAPNYITGDDFVDQDGDPFDDYGHGTHVAGTIGAADETIGVAPGVDIIGLDVFEIINGEHKAPIQSQVNALEWVLENHEEHNIVAVNMSLGSGFYTLEDDFSGNSRSDLIDQLEREGITVVAAAGNDYECKDHANNGDCIPNQEQNLAAPSIYATLSVGAVWQDDNDPFGYYQGRQIPGADRVAVFSQRLNSDNFILAPGTLIKSTYIDEDGFELLPGTSQASPHVAGSVALLQDAALQFGGRLLTPDEIVEILRSTADTIFDGDDENDNVINTGLSFPRLNIYNAVVELKRSFNDLNGTIASAFIGPNLDGETVSAISETIGIDENGTLVRDKDVDIFRFEVNSPGLVTIELSTRIDEPDDFDSYLRLFDENGNQLDFNDDDGEDLFSKIETELDPGTYYAGVSGYNNDSYNPNVADSGISGATGNYSIEFSLTNTDDAPEIKNGLIDINVEEDSESTIIDLSNVFTDIDNDDNEIIKIVSSNSNESLVTSAIEGNNLTLDYQDNQSGTAEITIRGESNGLTVENSFTVNVNPVDDAPEVKTALADINVEEDAENTVIDLSNVFTDLDDDDNAILKIVSNNSNAGLVNTTIEGNNLTLDYQDNQSGTAEITIRGESNGLTIEDNFIINVNPADEQPNNGIPESVFLEDPAQYLGLLRDFDGNDLGAGDAWKSIGSIDVQGDGDIEYVFVNPVNGRWATVGADITGVIDFTNHGQGGDTRIVGIYIDPLVEDGTVEKNSDFDSQRRFQNDLLIDNLTLIEGSGFNYDGDDFGLQEVYFQVNDGTAVLHAYMHADGNIQYANYQSKSDLEQFMTANGIDSSIWGDWL